MMTFEEYCEAERLAEKKRGRPKDVFTYSEDDFKHMAQATGNSSRFGAPARIRKIRNAYLDTLRRNNVAIVNAEKMKLDELKALLDKHHLQVAEPERKQDWKKHEQDVCEGINTLLADGFYTINGKPIDSGKFKAEVIGGAVESDINVANSDGKDFFVECKLDFATSRYFKYQVTADTDHIYYDHKKYLQGHNGDKDAVARVDDLFNKKVNISKFLTELLEHPKVKATWKQFTDNTNQLAAFIDELRQTYTSDGGVFRARLFAGRYPECFEEIAYAYDTYVDTYIDMYNDAILYIFDHHIWQWVDQPFDSDDFLIKARTSGNDLTKGSVFNTLDSLVKRLHSEYEYWESLPDDVKFDIRQPFDPNDSGFYSSIDNIKKIEAKIDVILNAQGKTMADANSLRSVPNTEKLTTFFTMFLSATKRKKHGADYNEVLTNTIADYGEKGIMRLCSEVTLETDTLAQMITDFYVEHDRCAYIQIADTVYQFDKDINPLALEGLPIFKEHLTNYTVVLLVSDDLKRISLQVTCNPPDESELKKHTLVSFKERDKNYVTKVLKPVDFKKP